MKHQLMINQIRNLICIVFVIIAPDKFYGQQLRTVETIYGKVIAMDSLNPDILTENARSNNEKYIYDIFHVKVVSHKKDTVLLALVYNLKKDLDSIANQAGFKLGQAYVFTVSDFQPCNSDFPKLYNCNYSLNQVCSSSGKIKFPPYHVIKRILYFGAIDMTLWEKL